MKWLNLLVFCLLSISTVLGKSFSLTVQVIALDTYSPVEGATVVFADKRGKKLFKTVTDKNGKATYPKCKSSKLIISATDAKNAYQINTTEYNRKFKGTEEQRLFLRPPVYKERSVIASKTTKIIVDSVALKELENCTDSLAHPAEFPGGIPALYTFITDNIKYPQEALEMGIRGKCYLKFVIDVDGNVQTVNLIKGVPDCPECDQEAIRVLCYMPKWIPGSCNGKHYATYYNLPITFSTR